jgi:hypothetical protein
MKLKLLAAMLTLAIIYTAWLPILRLAAQLSGGPLPVPVSVTQFGAKCDGAADDTLAINNALIVSQKVRMPSLGAGLCNVSGTIVLSGQQELMGDGRGTVTVQTTSPTADIVQVNSSYASIHDLSFSSSVTRTAGCSVNLLPTASSARVYNFNIFGAFRGVCFNGPSAPIVRDGDIRNTVVGGDSVYVNNCLACTLGPGITMDNPAGAQPEADIRILAAGDFSIINVEALHGGDCLLVNPTARNFVDSLRVTNSFFDTCGQHAAYLNAQGGSIQRSDFVQSWFATAQLEGVKLATSSGGAIQAVEFVSPHIFNNGLAANADQFLAADAGVTDVKILGGYSANNTNSVGLHFGPVSEFMVHGHRSGATAGFSGLKRALQIDKSATNFVVVGNDFSTNGSDVVVTPALDGVATIMHDNIATGIQSPYFNDTQPTTAWTVDANNAVTALNNGATVTFAAGGGLMIIANDTNGDQGLFLAGGGKVSLVSSTGGTFVASGTPAAGKIGVAFSSGTRYKIVSNFGSNVNIRTMLLRTRAGG